MTRPQLKYLPIFLRSLLIGFAISALFGPIGFLCIQRTLAAGRRSGFISGLGAVSNQSHNYFAASLMVLGIFLGSIFWWFLHSYLTSLFQNRIHRPALIWINPIAGLIILGFGFGALI